MDATYVSGQLYFIPHRWIPIEFNLKGFPLNLMEQARVTTYELGVAKFPGLVLIEGRDLNGGRRRKDDKQVRGRI